MLPIQFFYTRGISLTILAKSHSAVYLVLRNVNKFSWAQPSFSYKTGNLDVHKRLKLHVDGVSPVKLFTLTIWPALSRQVVIIHRDNV